jgi:predicted DNA-binding protein YlxM (UPF0122 family)
LKGDTLRMTMLYDFYGELLTEKQREYFDLYHNDDLSLSEIAENVGITRQGVYDIITRAENTLLELERKTGLINRFEQQRESLDRAEKLAETLFDRAAVCGAELLPVIEALQQTLRELKG